MSQTITVDGDEVIDATIDGEAVEEITIDGVLAWAAEVGLDGLTVTRQDGSYTANNNDHVVSNGGTITLPSPVQDGIVMITKVETRPELTGTVDGISEPYISGDESAVFVSDGNEWYSVDRNQLGAIPDSAVAHWPHDEGSGSTIADTIGDVDATLGSNATWQSGFGRGGFYVEYDSTASASDLGSAGNTLISDNWVANNEGAFGCWFNPQANDFVNFFGTETTDNGTDTACLLRPQNKIQWSLTVNDSRTDIRPSAYRTNDWQAVVFTCDGSNMFIYHSDSNDTVRKIISATAPGTDSNGLLDTDPTIGDPIKVATLEQDDAWFTDQHVTVSEAQDWVDATASDH